MSIFLNKDSKVIVQGITGGEGSKHTALMLKAGTQLVGGVNATSILLVGLAPLLWVVYAVWGTHEVRFRAALVASVSIAVLNRAFWAR